MHIISAFFRLSSILKERFHQLLLHEQPHAVRREESIRLVSESSDSIGGNQPSFTAQYEDFAHSYSAVKLCCFHATIYYVCAVLGYSFLVEDFSIINSLYFGSVLFTTVGFGVRSLEFAKMIDSNT